MGEEMKEQRQWLFHVVVICTLALIGLSCARGPAYKLCYSDDEGNTIVTEKTTRDMVKSLKKSGWPYTWDEENLKLTVGEITDRVATPIEAPDQMYEVQFEQCSEGIIVTEATIVTGKRKTLRLITSPSHIVGEERSDMSPSFAVILPFHLGKYKKK